MYFEFPEPARLKKAAQARQLITPKCLPRAGWSQTLHGPDRKRAGGIVLNVEFHNKTF